MDRLATMTYAVTGRVARITLERPHRGNAITFDMPRELAQCVERANLEPAVHVILLSGAGEGFCAGYDLTDFAANADGLATGSWPEGSPMDPRVVAANHDPTQPWDPVVDLMMMSRNVRGYCVAGGTDMALCSDLLVIEDKAKIGYPPARVWGSPTTAIWAYRIGLEKAKRLLFTGDSLSGAEALAWGLATEAPSRAELDARTEALVERIARVPVSQLVMMKRLLNQTVAAQGLSAVQTLGTVFDGMARHTREGYAFARRMREVGPVKAVRERDDPFGDPGRSTFKG